jgi:hypothetical protein
MTLRHLLDFKYVCGLARSVVFVLLGIKEDKGIFHNSEVIDDVHVLVVELFHDSFNFFRTEYLYLILLFLFILSLSKDSKS